MRVMTWNLWWRFGPWEQREAAIIDVIRRVDPDVLCLQEAWQSPDDGIAARLAASFGYHVVASEPIGRSDIGFTNAVLSRWPSNPIVDQPLPRADGSPGFRRVVAASVATPWGPWPIASTHLDHRFDASAARSAQVTRLLELAGEWRGDPTADLPVVLAGDLNAVPDSDEIRLLNGRRPGVDGIVFSDVWEQVGDGRGYTWRRDNPYSADSAWPDRRLDYVLVSWPRPKPTGNPQRCRLIGRPGDDAALWPSDHLAVVADLTTPT